jgi:hypothetical protein
MKKYELRIPRAVRMTEWETIVVEASNEKDALDNALHYTNVISSTFDTDDYETIDRYDDEIEIREIENGL